MEGENGRGNDPDGNCAPADGLGTSGTPPRHGEERIAVKRTSCASQQSAGRGITRFAVYQQRDRSRRSRIGKVNEQVRMRERAETRASRAILHDSASADNRHEKKPSLSLSLSQFLT